MPSFFSLVAVVTLELSSRVGGVSSPLPPARPGLLSTPPQQKMPTPNTKLNPQAPHNIPNPKPMKQSSFKGKDQILNTKQAQEATKALIDYSTEVVNTLQTKKPQIISDLDPQHYSGNHHQASLESDPECSPQLLSANIIPTEFLINDLSTVKDKVAMWVKLRYLLEKNELIPMDKNPYSWAGKAHDYAGWTAGKDPALNAIVITGSFTTKENHRFPSLGFVEYVLGEKVCVSRWDPTSKKLQVSVMHTSAIYLSIYKV
ncbi:hypothetical protein DSO57_1011056 [Entomophthora muscae]|uniref:Uncharacterized protein n=1 Tax=Entomophthora muscae TaxID=34485 RepID=A0ACC2TTB4_9FUNG|nr:hypothetical protein DSO57_1011056 [Entomophthora muscae]